VCVGGGGGCEKKKGGGVDEVKLEPGIQISSRWLDGAEGKRGKVQVKGRRRKSLERKHEIMVFLMGGGVREEGPENVPHQAFKGTSPLEKERGERDQKTREKGKEMLTE